MSSEEISQVEEVTFGHESLADAAVALFVCALATVIFFVTRRLIDFEDPRIASAPPTVRVPHQAMGHVSNPFALQLLRPAERSMKNGVTLKLTSKSPSSIRVLWGVNIKDIYPVIFSNWEEYTSMSTEFLQSISLSMEEFIFPEPVTEKILDLKPVSDIDFGSVPRSRYPLVVMVTDLIVTELPLEEALHYTEIAAMATIFHIKDEHCPAESHVFAQYVRSPSGRPFNLKQLFVNEGDSHEEMPTQCVVCQSSRVQRVLMPCRHACVCSECFPKLHQCPMCRSPIVSFFSYGGNL